MLARVTDNKYQARRTVTLLEDKIKICNDLDKLKKLCKIQ